VWGARTSLAEKKVLAKKKTEKRKAMHSKENIANSNNKKPAAASVNHKGADLSGVRGYSEIKKSEERLSKEVIFFVVT
jgi:hypothetical protein